MGRSHSSEDLAEGVSGGRKGKSLLPPGGWAWMVQDQGKPRGQAELVKGGGRR